MIAELVLPDGSPVQIAGDTDAPRAIIVVQEAFGVNDHIRDVADRFADAGLLRGRARAVSPRRLARDRLRRLPRGDGPHGRT